MSIVASQQLGHLGTGQDSPVEFHWRWYYHVPRLALWVTILLLLIVVSMPVVGAVAAVFTGEGLLEILTMFFQVLFVLLMFAGIVSIAVYAMNLPFMLLATRSAFFQQRFRRFFHLTEEPSGKSAMPPVVALGSEL